MAILSDQPAPGFERQLGESFDAHYRRTGDLLEQMRATSDALPEGQVEGALLAFPIADGKALYLVQKAEPLTLQHIPFLDGYQIPGAHLRGLDLEDVHSEQRHNRAMAALMARNRSAR